MNMFTQAFALQILKQLKPLAHERKMPQKLFEALCPLHKRVGTDLCVFDKDGKIWLTGRPVDKNDPFSGKWHIPGGIHAPSESNDQVLKRLLKKEFDGAQLGHIQQIPYLWDFPIDERGSTYVSFVYVAKCVGGMGNAWGSRGEFYSVNNLPNGLVHVQREQAVRAHEFAREKGMF